MIKEKIIIIGKNKKKEQLATEKRSGTRIFLAEATSNIFKICFAIFTYFNVLLSIR